MKGALAPRASHLLRTLPSLVLLLPCGTSLSPFPGSFPSACKCAFTPSQEALLLDNMPPSGYYCLHLSQLLIVYLLLRYSPLLVLTKISSGFLTTSQDTPLGLFSWFFSFVSKCWVSWISVLDPLIFTLCTLFFISNEII